MTPEVLSCPYCNTRFTLPPSEAAAGRVRCPRCGDSFAHRAAPAEVNGEPRPPLAPPEPVRPARPSNWFVARLVLGVMAGMAVLGLTYALLTVNFRRQNDRPKVPAGTQSILPGPAATPPAELAALGYLPADCGLVAGLHLAELLHDEQGKKLWQRLRQGPAGAPLELVEERTGLKPEQIEHLVLGVHTAQPGAVLVVRTRQPYNLSALAKVGVRTKKESFRGKPVYRFPIGPVSEGLLFQPARDTLVLSVGLLQAKLSDLQAIPQKPSQGADGLPQAIRGCLADRLDRASLLWAAASLPDLPGLEDLVNLAGVVLPEEARILLLNLKTFAAGIRLQKDVTLGAALQGKDEAAARALAALVEKHRPPGVDSFKVIGPPGEAAPRAQRTWVLIQVRAGPGEVSNLLDRLAASVP
jgi:predicted Zn finger-like uncharacterized protein